MEEIVKKLQQKGYRLTKQRQQIIEILTHHPRSVAEIVASLKFKGLTPDKATVYRTLDCFVALGIAGETQFKDKARKYELLSEGDYHHHHLVCDECGRIENVTLDEVLLLKMVKQKSDFRISSHSLEFFGVCESCQ